MISRRDFLNTAGKTLAISALTSSHPILGAELPNVLIIGDSISIGYTPFVRKAMEGEANIYHNVGNARHTGIGILDLDEWLEGGPWDVIHFNWGLHDLCYRDENGSKDLVYGTVTTDLKTYKRNLQKLVHRLKETGACLIWASTTPVPAGEPGRIQGSEMKYNKAAGKIMAKNGIVVDDLHRYIFNESYRYYIKSGNVHFTAEGYQKLSKKVAASIAECLKDSQRIKQY